MHTTDLTEFFKGANLARRMAARFDLAYCWPLTRQGGH